MTDIDDQLKDPDILHKETYDNIWAFNAGIIIDKGATLNIDSKDTKWLKIVGGEEGDGKKAGAYKGQRTLPNSIVLLVGCLLIQLKSLLGFPQ